MAALLGALSLTAMAAWMMRQARSTLVWNVVFGVLLTGCFLLAVLYLVADHFTGAGINDAVWFHLRFGLRDVGLGAYLDVVLITAVGTVAGLVLLLATAFMKRSNTIRTPAWAFACLGLALGVNPALPEIWSREVRNDESASDFGQYYREPWIAPRAEEFPKNLVFIYAEGLERTYFDQAVFPGLITRLRRLEGQGYSFTDIRQVAGTEFTVGGIVASQCGIPLFAPSHGNAMGAMDRFLPDAEGLGNLLHQSGYYLSFWGGASLDFAGKGKFFRTHKFDEVFGRDELTDRQPDPDYLNHWGLFDDALLPLALQRFEKLAEARQPFALFLLTLDTHHPDGHISRAGEGIQYDDGSNPMLNAVAVADELIADFIERVRSSPAGENTVIVLASDHLGMESKATPLLNQAERRNLFLILTPDELDGRRVDTPGSTLDIGPTLLPFLGFDGEIGLGRDLLDPSNPATEREYIQQPENLRRWRGEIASFWRFPTFAGSMTIDPADEFVVLDGRRLALPVLLRLKSAHEVEPIFCGNPSRPLVDQIGGLPEDVPYVLIDRTINMSRFFDPRGESGWCMVSRVGDHLVKVARISSPVTLTREEIDHFLADEFFEFDQPEIRVVRMLRSPKS